MDKNTEGNRRGGFTLIEMLVVIAVIGILIALLFPALTLVRERAWETRGRDLCSQTAAAWSSLLTDNRRFPSKELISEYASDEKKVGGDLMFSMDTKMAGVLNWWKKEHELSGYDLKLYNKEHDSRDYGWSSINSWPKDTRFGRSSLQQKWGIVAPWAERHLGPAAERDAETDPLNSILKAATVRVILDMDGDNRIDLTDLKEELGLAALDSKGEPLVLRKSVVAWVYADYDEKGKGKSKVLTSW